MYWIALIPLAILVYSYSAYSRKIIAIVTSRHYKVLRDKLTTDRETSISVKFGSGCYWYLDVENDILRNVTEIHKDAATLAALNDHDLSATCSNKVLSSRLLIAYLGLLPIIILLMWVLK